VFTIDFIIDFYLCFSTTLKCKLINIPPVFNVSQLFNVRTTAIYGGTGVADQIADLKRGCHIVIATPGRMIDILTMQAGRLLSLARTSFLVLDESDRLFDMGFGPQIQAIAAAIRPDRQLVCFSATFPKSVESLARKSLKYPVEVIVGGRSVASDNVTQYGEVIQEQDKFLRLLHLLGEHVDEGKKAIVFVDTQAKADSLFEQLTRCGYCCLSLHGGKEQEDRDSTILDFKQSSFLNVLVATSVAGRGLDVKSCACVVNYSPPNHVEDYVHRVGRTGRANMNGVAYTFVNPVEETKYSPVVVRAMSEAGQMSNISPELRTLSDEYKEKVKKGEAKWAGSGYKGKGYSYDSSELTDAQKIARIEKREALIEAGLLDPDEKDPLLEGVDDDEEDAEKNLGEAISTTETEGKVPTAKAPIQISAELLALPGMQEALMRKAGMLPVDGEVGLGPLGSSKSLGSAHFYEEFEINDYPREARWKITQKETTSRIQDEFQTAITLKGEFFGENRVPEEGERKLYLHLEAQSEQLLRNCVHEIRRILNEETLRVGAKGTSAGSHRYSVLG
jgi:ATP-dependent RNA helicase DDX46/PRP5